MLLLACFVPSAQRILIAGLNFDVLRLMIVAGTVRVVIWSEYRQFTWVGLDYAMVAWAIVGTTVYTMQQGDVAGLVFKLGASYDALGTYFLFRCVLKEWRDLDRITLMLGIIALPVLVLFLVEYVTARNPFAMLGGVPLVTAVRDGKLRCQGPYAHPILSGCFWAIPIPLIASQWWTHIRARQVVAIVGTVCALGIIVLCSSSTPILSIAGAAIGAMAFALRRHMAHVRMCVLGLLIFLHIVMKGPVWSLLAKVDVLGGSTGWHRYHLIDECIKHFEEWAALGTRDTGHWGYGLTDVTNQYILEGVRGGLITMVLFVVLLWIAFKYVGDIWKAVEVNAACMALSWGVGVAVFVHALNFIGVSYFGQIIFLWYLTLAAAGSLEALRRHKPIVYSTRSPTEGNECGLNGFVGA